MWGRGLQSSSFPGVSLAEPGTGSDWWRGSSPAHTKEEAAVAAPAAPAMLCYVTRPDAVLMEVEVEAKANGEDCLNQVRMKGQVGTRSIAQGGGASWQCQAPGRATCQGPGGAAAAAEGSASPGSSPQAPGGRTLLHAGVGCAASMLTLPERVGVGAQRTGAAAGHPTPQPSTFPGRRRSSTPAAGVCEIPVLSPQGLAMTTASQEEVSGNGLLSWVAWQTSRALVSCCFSDGPFTSISEFAEDQRTVGFGHLLLLSLSTQRFLRSEGRFRTWNSGMADSRFDLK